MGKKATAVFMIFCIAAFLLCSCSDSLQEDLSEASQEEERKETVTLRFAWWGNEERAEKTNQAVVLFMEKNPDIIVKTVSFPFDEYVEIWTSVQKQAIYRMCGRGMWEQTAITWTPDW